MKSRSASNPAARKCALIFTALMVVPVLLPGVSANHLDPELFDLPEVHPLTIDDSTCFDTEIRSMPASVANALAASRDAGSPGPFWEFVERDGRTVPLLCFGSPGNGGASQEYADIVTTLNTALRTVRDVMNAAENFTSSHAEMYAPYNFTTLLYDGFEEHPDDVPRIGGYGDWQRIVVSGPEDAWHAVEEDDLYQNPRQGWRFSDPDGAYYPAFTDTALVSPVIDLGGVDVGPGANEGEYLCQIETYLDGCVHAVTGPRDVWEKLKAEAIGRAAEGGPSTRNQVALSLGQVENALTPLFDRHERQGAAVLEVHHRFNLANGVDGVRYEVWDHYPTPAELQALFTYGTIEENVTHGVEGVTILEPVGPLTEDPEEQVRDQRFELGEEYSYPRQGGFPSKRGETSRDSWNAWQDASSFGEINREKKKGFTGALNETTTAAFDLSEFAGKQVHLVVRARTELIVGEDYFKDPEQFRRQTDYGYFLDSVNVTAQVKPHNIRVFEEPAAPHLRLPNAEGGLDWTIRPPRPGAEEREVTVYVTNFGRYVENVTARIEVDCRRACAGTTPVPVIDLGPRVLQPGEVWRASFVPPSGAMEKLGSEWDVRVIAEAWGDTDGRQPSGAPANVTYEEGETRPGESNDERGVRVNSSENWTRADPWQPRDEQYYGVRADNDRTITFVVREERRVETTTLPGKPRVEIDPPVLDKDKPRTLKTTFRNSGNTVEDVQVQVTVSAEDGSRTFEDFFLTSPTVHVGWMEPGETAFLEWELRPYVTGAFPVTIAFVNATNGNLLGAASQQILYSGRTSGVVCADDAHVDRACTAGWVLDRPQALQQKSPRAAWRADNGDVWLVGDLGLVYAYTDVDDNGVRDWVNMSDEVDARAVGSTFDDTANLTAVSGHASGNGYVVYVAGERGTAWRFDGAWTRLAIQNATGAVVDADAPDATPHFNAVLAANSTRVWFAGDDGVLLALNASHGDALAPANVSAKIRDGTHDLTAVDLRAMTAASPNLAWTVGDQGIILAFNGAYWSVTRSASGTQPTLHTVRAFTDGLVLAGGDAGVILVREGKTSGEEWHVVRDHDPAEPAILGFGRSPAPEAFTWAMGAEGTILRCDACGDGGVGSRRYVATEDGRGFAVTEDGVILPCQDCVSGGGFTEITSPVPFLSQESMKPVLSNGTHYFNGNLAWKSSNSLTSTVTFRVQYQDAEGAPPQYVRAVFKNETDPARDRVVNMTLKRGSAEDGAIYEGKAKLSAPEAMTIDYHFETSDGLFSVSTQATRAPSHAPIRVGGDLWTGGDAPDTASEALARNATVYPPFAEATATATAADTDWYVFHVAPGASFNVTLTESVGDATATVYPVVRNEDGALVPGDAYGSLTGVEDEEPLTVHAPADADARWLVKVTGDEDASADYAVSVTAHPENDVTPAFPVGVHTHFTPPTTPQSWRLAASVLGVVDDGGAGDVLAIVQDGFLLRFSGGNVYQNLGDWDPDYHLRSLNENGTAWWGTNAVNPGALYFRTGSPGAPGQVQDAVLTVRHNVWHVDTDPNAKKPVEIRLAFENAQQRGTTTVSLTQAMGCLPKSRSASSTDGGAQCTTGQHRVVSQYYEPHSYSDWVTESFDVSAMVNDYLHVNPQTGIAGVSFILPAKHSANHLPDGTQWAVDEVKLEIDGETVIHWAGEAIEGEVISIPMEDVPTPLTQKEDAWAPVKRPVFGFGRSPTLNVPEYGHSSLWHKSGAAEQPVWVANLQDKDSSGLTFTDPETNALTQVEGMKSWLVTPIVDLRHTADPVLEFKHAFSGRLRVVNDCLDVADVGVVMMQAFDEDAGAWTRWVKVEPEGGYPGRAFNGAPDVDECPPSHSAAKDQYFEYGDGFYHRTRGLDELKSSGNLLQLENHDTVRVPLSGVNARTWVDERTGEEVVVQSAEHFVRFAFVFNASRGGVGAGIIDDKATNVKHAGWYVSDVRVIGERKLGQDLAVTDFAPVVGYDWENIGFGPSTDTEPVTVPFTLNVTNDGRFDVPGFTIVLEAVEVLNPVLGLTRSTPVDTVRYDQVVAPDETRQVNLSWRVPAGKEGTDWVVRAIVTPLGVEDENPADNTGEIGSVANPVPVMRQEGVTVRVEALPRAESADLARFLPVYVVNTGNVPMTGFTITRRIFENRGSLGMNLVDERAWTTDRAVPEGAAVPVNAVNQSVDILRDLYWTPPRQGTYIVESVLQQAGTDLVLRNRVIVDAFGTYLFDDAEGDHVGAATRGVAQRGNWELTGDGWVHRETGGFEDSGAYHFGDAFLGTYPDTANASLVTPTIDLTSASTARLTFFHKFALEEGYDAGVVEASTDGGKTWRILEPEENARFGLPKGYVDAVVNAGNPVDGDGDPWTPVSGFTGASTDLEGNLDGWVSSRFNLGQIPDLVEETTYVNFTVDGQSTRELTRCLFAPDTMKDACSETAPYYADDSWLTGDVQQDEFWAVMSDVDNGVLPKDPAKGFLWSGSVTADDDGTRLLLPTVLNLTVDLTSVSKESTEQVIMEYRDWMNRDGLDFKPRDGEFGASESEFVGLGDTLQTKSMGTVYSYRTNWTNHTYFVTDQDGLWWSWRVDLTEHKGEVVNLTFIYTPFQATGTDGYGGDGGTVTSSSENSLTDASKSWKSGAWTTMAVAITEGTGAGQLRYIQSNTANKLVLDTDYEDGKWAVQPDETSRYRIVPKLQEAAVVDPGWVIDDLSVFTERETRGRKERVQVLYDMDDVAEQATSGHCFQESQNVMPCVKEVSKNPKLYGFQPEQDFVSVTDASRAGEGWHLYQATEDEPFVALPAREPSWTTIGLESDRKWIQEFRDHRGGKRLPTGEESRVFWSGQKIVPADEPKAVGHNIMGGMDSRLVTPAIDLGKVAGSDALLEFWHFYGFHVKQAGGLAGRLSPEPDDMGDIGVVEYQVWDPVKNDWGAWHQLYDPDAPAQGGYPRKMALDYEGSVTADPWLIGTDLETHTNASSGQRYVYGYMGKSVSRDDDKNGWVRERFDLSDLIGERVRLSFRQVTLALDPGQRSAVGDDITAHCKEGNEGGHDAGMIPAQPHCDDIDGINGYGPGQAGWFIDEVRVIGDTLAGKPVTLRFRAGTDDGISKGGWTIDDITVAGASYGRNVGVFLEEAPNGGAPGRTAWVNGTLRNLADGVRRNLAVEVLDATLSADGEAPAFPIEFEAVPVDGGVPFSDPTGVDTRGLLTGIDLPARGAIDFAFRMTVPESASVGENRRVIVRVVEFNEAATTDPANPVFTRITDNEVEGFVSREIGVRIDRNIAAEAGKPIVTPALADVNEPVTITVPVENPGFIPVTFEASCTARYIREWEEIDHRRMRDNIPRYADPVPCEGLVDSVAVGAETSSELTFTFTPTTDGFWNVTFDAEATSDTGESVVREVESVRVMVGREPFFYRDSFEDARVRDDWSYETGYFDESWLSEKAFVMDDSRAFSGNWSLRAGLSDDEFNSDTSKSYDPLTNYTITSPWIDLHNASKGDPLFLRFKHLPRLAHGDGADVAVEVLANEEFPLGGASGKTCKIHPTGGYDGPVLSYFSPDLVNGVGGRYGNDTNPAFVPWPTRDYAGPAGVFASDGSGLPENVPSSVREFVLKHMDATEKRFFTGFEERWRTAEFNLADAECDIGENKASVLGHTVRFHFNMYTGRNDAPLGETECGDDKGRVCDDHAPDNAGLERGRGQGWFIDDVAISGYNLNFSAPETTFFVKDNATKLFPATVRNDALYEDHVRVYVDENASSAPAGTGSVTVDDPVLGPVRGDNETLAWTHVQMPRDPGLLPILYNLRVVAESALDPTIERERVIPLDFFPDKYADLKLTVDMPEGRVQEGSTAVLPITVENLGLVAAPAPAIVLEETHGDVTRTCVVSAGASGDRVKSDDGCPASAGGRNVNRDITSFFTDPGASRAVYAYAWSPLPGKGDHTLTLIVDPLGDIEEYSKSDNRQTLEIEVTELLQPDLELTADGLTLRAGGRVLEPDTTNGDVIRYEVEEGEDVVFELAVRNRGPVGATRPDVRGFIGPLSLTLPADKRPDFIPAGSEQVVAFPAWQAQKGEWILQFNARTDLVELSDTNNRVPASGLILLTVKGFEVSASLESLDRVLEPGERVTLNLTLANDGSTAEEVDLTAGLPEGWRAEFDANPVFLRRGETGALARVVPVTVTTSDRAVAGEHVITVQAVARENAMKAAIATGKMTIDARYGLDVAPVRHASPPGIVNLPVEITNTGNAPGPFKVSANLPAGWAFADDAPTVTVTPFTTETKTLRLVTPPGTDVGAYDAMLTIALPDEDVKVPVTVNVQPWREIRFTEATEDPVTPDALAFDVQAENFGNVRAPFTVLTPDLPDGWSVDVTPPGASLAPGESRAFRVTVEPPADVEFGEWTVPLYAHFVGVQPGSPEGRANRGELVVPIVQPDFVIQEFTFSPRVEIEPLTRVIVRAPVQNEGNLVAENVKVALFVDDVLIEAVEIARLEPGESRDVLFNWTAVGGEHAMTVVVDPFQDVREIARDNNAATRVVVVNGEQQTVRGTPATTVDTPGFGVVTLALAAIGAALVAGRPRRSKK